MSRVMSGPGRWWFVCGLSAVLVFAAAWLLVISPQQAAAGAARERAAEVETQAVAAAAQAEKLRTQNSELDAVKKELEALQGRIPDGEQVSALLVDANRLAGTSGVALTSFRPGSVAALDSSAPDKGTARLGYIAVTMTGTGRYDQVRDYLTKLEGLNRALVVTSISVARASGSGDGKTGDPAGLSVSINARVFVRGDAVPAPAKATASPGGGS